MAEFKWSRQNGIYEIDNLDCYDTIIVLPEDKKIETAMDTYTNRFNYHVEYLHYCSRGLLNAFISHNKNMLKEKWFVINCTKYIK